MFAREYLITFSLCQLDATSNDIPSVQLSHHAQWNASGRVRSRECQEHKMPSRHSIYVMHFKLVGLTSTDRYFLRKGH